MTYRTNVATAHPASTLSQTVFVLIGLAIITGGLWSLYMGDAPYHPDGVATPSEVFVVVE